MTAPTPSRGKTASASYGLLPLLGFLLRLGFTSTLQHVVFKQIHISVNPVLCTASLLLCSFSAGPLAKVKHWRTKTPLWKHVAISFYSVYASICQTKI